MNSPHKALVIIFYVSVMMGLIMLLSPEELYFSKDFVLRIPSWNDFRLDTAQNQLPTQVVQVDKTIDSLEKALKEAEKIRFDNYAPSSETLFVEVKGKSSDNPIEFPPNHSQALDKFFEALRTIATQEAPIRILHYGDSQLDGDRISEYLRERFQHQFGGCGVGLFPITEAKNMRSTLAQTASDNWKKQAVYTLQDGKPLSNRYSVLGSYYWIGKQDNEKYQKATLTIARTPNSSLRNAQFEKFHLLLKNIDAPLIVEYAFNDANKQVDTIPPADHTKWYPLPIAGNLEELDLWFYAKGETYFYGASLDCSKGIALDNIAFRGSSGTDFIHFSRTHLREQFDLLNVRLIILQFGVNVVPNVIEDYKYYENSLYRQLNFLKTLVPEADVLLIGVSDMAQRLGGRLRTYPNIALVRNAQRSAAFKARCAYWDLFLAMGGENSIINWANASPPLAQKDYTHFTRRGAKLVGEMLYNQLMKEYNDYLRRKDPARKHWG
ncbi:MAG: hypothetical protein NZ521_01925 [Flammeovirgaceae bacterium]|nr:hypothetical protein [Flammeovirgaceae bacterium]MDW8286862.1 hypothetical protein [Flammeovirgaceae bacterium]